jgi:hypothetical protein
MKRFTLVLTLCLTLCLAFSPITTDAGQRRSVELLGSVSGQESPEQAFLTAKYSLVTTVARIPPAVLTYLSARMKHDARLANPGERFNSTDIIDTRYPMRRLVLAGVESRSWFVSYEHGGRGYHRHLVVFTRSGDRVKLAYARTFLSKAATLEELRQLVKTGQMSEGEEF